MHLYAKPVFVAVLILCALESWRTSATAQDVPGIQTDTVRIGGRAGEQGNVNDTSRWDDHLLYVGGHLEVKDAGREAEFGVGLHLRVPVWRYGKQGEFFLYGAVTYGMYSVSEYGVGLHPYKYFYIGAGYGKYQYHPYTGGHSRAPRYSARNAAMVFYGVRHEFISIEIRLYIWTEPQIYYTELFYPVIGEWKRHREWGENAGALRFALGI